MGSDRLTAYRITDYLVPSMILKNPMIEKDLHEDGFGFTIPDVVSDYWIGVTLNDEGTIACFRANQLGAVHYQGHAHVLPQYRRLSVECNRTALKWCFDNIPCMEVATVIIPSSLENVINHVLRVGFKKTGCIEKSYLHNDKLVNQELLSINRKQVEAFT